MNNDKLLAHRCKGSLKANVSIRYGYSSEFMRLQGDIKAWRLFCYEYDYDYMSMNSHHVSEISYCPYCGEKLEKMEEIK